MEPRVTTAAQTAMLRTIAASEGGVIAAFLRRPTLLVLRRLRLVEQRRSDGRIVVTDAGRAAIETSCK
jgi:hypothetical protein